MIGKCKIIVVTTITVRLTEIIIVDSLGRMIYPIDHMPWFVKKVLYEVKENNNAMFHETFLYTLPLTWIPQVQPLCMQIS